MQKEHRGRRRACWAALVAAIFCVLPGRAGAHGLNFDLLIETLRARANPAKAYPAEGQFSIPGQAELPGPGPKLKPVQELMAYVECLKGQVDRSCSFRADLSGEAAARQLGYSRLFASAYEEMAWRAKMGEKGQESFNRSDLISGFDRIVHEEQVIDRLMANQKRYAATVAYLRALQNGDVIFPGPQPLAPVPAVLLIQLASAYPDVNLDINDPLFAMVYRRTRDFAAARMRESGRVWAQEIIAEYRRLTLKSAAEQ